jgi:DNA-directed RNA polymerase specialized sigma24 family protein
MSTLRAVRASLVEVSRRYSRVSHEAEDLAHDLILSALRRGTPLDGETFLRSAHGAARRHGAFLARSSGRRRAREAWSADEQVADAPLGVDEDVESAPLSVLSPVLRTTLFLLCLGLEKAELRLALGVTDAALRKRFQALREQGPLARPDLPLSSSRTPAHPQMRRSQVELLRRLATRRMLAASDPDGHGVIFAEELTSDHSAATASERTSGASPTGGRTSAKGSPCSTRKSRTSPSSS